MQKILSNQLKNINLGFCLPTVYQNVMQMCDFLEHLFQTTENGHFQNFHDICNYCMKTDLQ